MIKLKSEKEISIIRSAAQSLSAWLTTAVSGIRYKNLRTGRQVRDDFVSFVSHSFAGQASFPFQEIGDYGEPICLSINDEIVHCRPDDREFKTYDVIKIDAGIKINGFCVDAARTTIVPWEPPLAKDANKPELIEARIVTEAIGRASRIAHLVRRNFKEGWKVSDISRIIENAVNQLPYEDFTEYGIVTDFCGHGIGSELHEEPLIPNYTGAFMSMPDPLLKPGMVLCIEPMYTLGRGDVVLGTDKWRISTADGTKAIHHEDMIYITPEWTVDVLT